MVTRQYDNCSLPRCLVLAFPFSSGYHSVASKVAYHPDDLLLNDLSDCRGMNARGASARSRKCDLK